MTEAYRRLEKRIRSKARRQARIRASLVALIGEENVQTQELRAEADRKAYADYEKSFAQGVDTSRM